ncbi:hypothetical protein PENTCL1PPCAC_16624, partial [Pristionchus entomophagus]
INPAPLLSVIGFQENVQSRFVQAYQLTIEKEGRSREFELALQHESVAVLLYHRQQQQFLVVQLFRPAVYVSRVLKLAENAGKTVHDIDWSRYGREKCDGVVCRTCR